MYQEIAGQVFLHPNQLGSKLVARPKSSIILQPADDLELPFESQVRSLVISSSVQHYDDRG